MDKMREEELARRLGRYVDGELTVADFSDAETGELLADIEAVNMLKLGFGGGSALDSDFSTRLRERVVAEAARRTHFPLRWVALAAMFLLLIVPLTLYFGSSLLSTKRIAEQRRQVISSYGLQPMSEQMGEDYLMASFAARHEERIERVYHNWVETRMEETYEKYMRDRGERL